MLCLEVGEIGEHLRLGDEVVVRVVDSDVPDPYTPTPRLPDVNAD